MTSQYTIRWIGLVLILLAFSIMLLAAQPSLPTARYAELERAVLAELEETRTPGEVIAIVQGETIIYQKGFGVANIETAQAVTPEMLFRIGSMTKIYTAAAGAGRQRSQTRTKHRPNCVVGGSGNGRAFCQSAPYQMKTHDA